jgi:signal transduction histidine kinase
MVETTTQARENNERTMAEALARTLRHEIGDFLQKVYASVAILQGRLPEQWDLERDILTRLRHGAEGCKKLVDAIQDFLCPLRLACQEIDLANLTSLLINSTQTISPPIQVTLEEADSVTVHGDADRLAQMGRSLLVNAAEAGASRVEIHLRRSAAAHDVEWTFCDNGPGLVVNLGDRLFRPFFTTRPGHAGLGLALARKIVEAHNGRIAAGNRPDGGFCAEVRLPIPEKELAGAAGPG